MQGAQSDTILLCSHPPVITTGTSTKPEHLTTPAEILTAQGVPLVPIGRGGSVTYHGPEQLVAYPIIDLKNHKTDVGWYMRSLEEVIILTLRDFQIAGFRIPEKTGVWVRDDAKIAFIGVKISRWCTYHGVSINVRPCAERFSLINPCGLGSIQVTSLHEECDSKPTVEEVAARFKDNFATVFGYNSV